MNKSKTKKQTTLVQLGLAIASIVASLVIGGTIVYAQELPYCTEGVSCTQGMPAGSGCKRKWNSNQAANLTRDPHGYYIGSTACGIVWFGSIPSTIPCGWWDIDASCV